MDQDNALTRLVMPQEVGLAICVEIGHALDLPVARNAARREIPAADPRGAVHEPDLQRATRLVMPQEIGLAIGVEMGHARDLPVARDGTGSQIATAGPRGCVHEPDVTSHWAGDATECRVCRCHGKCSVPVPERQASR